MIGTHVLLYFIKLCVRSCQLVNEIQDSTLNGYNISFEFSCIQCIPLFYIIYRQLLRKQTVHLVFIIFKLVKSYDLIMIIHYLCTYIFKIANVLIKYFNVMIRVMFYICPCLIYFCRNLIISVIKRLDLFCVNNI